MKSSTTFRSEDHVRELVRQSTLLRASIDAGAAANEPESGANPRQWLVRVLAGIATAAVGVAGMVALASTAMSPFGAFVALPAAFLGLAALGCWVDEKLASPRPA